MKILLTNDDGIDAPGLWVAARALQLLGEVTIIAPAANCSGFGAALPAKKHASCSLYHHTHHPGITAYALDSTPAACVQAGLRGFQGIAPPDIVVSGVNAGANLGRDILYSGTVGAAITANLLGFPAVAFSLDCESVDSAHWHAADIAIRETFNSWLIRWHMKGIVLNVNIPNREDVSVPGVRMTRLSKHSFLHTDEFYLDAEQLHAFKNRFEKNGNGASLDLRNDIDAVREGWISITPLRPFPDVLSDAPVAGVFEYQRAQSEKYAIAV
ncbi:MAG: 5'/3'-nucleotidase SurE [Caldilineales bacterium]|nr:5'/3'-nucleotidase SurE [Caldilineales bacterium]